MRLLRILLLLLPLQLFAADILSPDGGRYVGPLADGLRQGKGRIEWDNGARFEGSFDKGLYSGRGKMKFASGDVYEGEYAQGMMSGKGRYVSVDGGVYTGDYRRDYANGQGRYQRADGEIYEGGFKDGQFEGRGKLTSRDSTYTGEFRAGWFGGVGELAYKDGGSYKGEFKRGQFHGKGRSQTRDGDVYEGEFAEGDFVSGVHTSKGGVRIEGKFANWLLNGPGTYRDNRGTVYEGKFDNGTLNGRGKMTGKNGARYEGDFKNWLPDGQGEMRLANGDVYKGGFSGGLYAGQGTLTYAKAQADGRTKDSGVWEDGRLAGEKEERQNAVNVETALYKQRELLDRALAGIAPRDPSRVNMYMLSVAGDGSQEVFRREVEFVRDQFGARFGMKGRTLELVNSRTTVDKYPLATQTSLREGLKTIAAKMDKEKDILFLFLTSHGSREHEVSLAQNNMYLRGLPAKTLASMLKESGIKWKVVVVSACFGGGFIDPLKDERTLILAAARHDRMSFGCSDDNDFTYFGRAFFKESLPKSGSFQEAFKKAEVLIREWEVADMKAAEKSSEGEYSLPQMFVGGAVERHLKEWWK